MPSDGPGPAIAREVAVAMAMLAVALRGLPRLSGRLHWGLGLAMMVLRWVVIGAVACFLVVVGFEFT